MRYVSEPTKILIFREQDATLDVRKFHELLVHGALLKLTHRKNVVSR